VRRRDVILKDLTKYCSLRLFPYCSTVRLAVRAEFVEVHSPFDRLRANGPKRTVLGQVLQNNIPFEPKRDIYLTKPRAALGLAPGVACSEHLVPLAVRAIEFRQIAAKVRKTSGVDKFVGRSGKQYYPCAPLTKRSGSTSALMDLALAISTVRRS
jgi:hypothetical protein